MLRFIQRSSRSAAANLSSSSSAFRSHNTSGSLLRSFTSTQSNSTANTTVDAAEISKFSAQADRWWQEERGPFSGLHRLNNVRVPLIRSAILENEANLSSQISSSSISMQVEALKGRRILDIGCGGGILAEALARLGADVTGVDASADNVRAAAYHASADPLVKARTSYIASTAETLAAEVINGTRKPFDAVVASEVLEHVSSAPHFLEACATLVKPGGRLIVTTINRTPASFALAIMAAEYVLRIVPAGTHEWAKFVKPEELEEYLRPCGMEISELRGLRYNPIKDDWSFCSDLGVNYAAIATKR